MADFLTALGSLFTFLFTQLGSIATFFTGTTLGQIILGVTLFVLVIQLGMYIVSKLKL